MLRRKISVKESRVNGAMGVAPTQFRWPALCRDQIEAGEPPDAVCIKLDDLTIGAKMKDSDNLVAVASILYQQYFKQEKDVERRIMPLMLNWAVAVPKLQGTTLNKAIIELGKNNFAKGQVYVAISRMKTLHGIALFSLELNKLLSGPYDEKAFPKAKIKTIVLAPTIDGRHYVEMERSTIVVIVFESESLHFMLLS